MWRNWYAYCITCLKLGLHRGCIMSDAIRIAIVGLGEAGEIFSEHLLEKIQLEKKPVKIVALADPDLDGPVAMGFLQSHVPIYPNYLDILKHCDEVDIIFNLSGDAAVSQRLRIELLAKKNNHTMIASEEMARLLWYFFGENKDLPRAVNRNFQVSWKMAVSA